MTKDGGTGPNPDDRIAAYPRAVRAYLRHSIHAHAVVPFAVEARADGVITAVKLRGIDAHTRIFWISCRPITEEAVIKLDGDTVQVLAATGPLGGSETDTEPTLGSPMVRNISHAPENFHAATSLAAIHNPRPFSRPCASGVVSVQHDRPTPIGNARIDSAERSPGVEVRSRVASAAIRDGNNGHEDRRQRGYGDPEGNPEDFLRSLGLVCGQTGRRWDPELPVVRCW